MEVEVEVEVGGTPAAVMKGLNYRANCSPSRSFLRGFHFRLSALCEKSWGEGGRAGGREREESFV